jgi:hypothetical protein
VERKRPSGAGAQVLRLAALAAAAAILGLAQAQDFRWAVSTGGSWSVPSNWWGNAVPASHPAHDVYVDFHPYIVADGGNVYDSGHAVNINRVFLRGTLRVTAPFTLNGLGSQIVGGLELNATLGGAGDLTITGPLVINAGTLGAGGPATAGSLILTPTGSKGISRDLTFGGGMWQGASVFAVHSTVTNTGTFAVTDGVTWHDGVFNNAGLFRKDAPGTVMLGASWHGGARAFNNSGTVRADAGEVRIVASGSHTGTFEASGPGSVRFTDGTATFFGGSTLLGGVELASGTFNIAGATTVGGAGPRWTGGTVTGSGAVGGASWTWAGGSKTLGGTWANAATAVWDAGPVFAVHSSITNTGTLDIRGDLTYHDGVVNNSGLIVKSAGTGQASLNSAWHGGTRGLNNTGTVQSTSGRLALFGSGALAGTWRGTGGIVAFQGDAPTLAGANTATGDVRIDGAVIQTGPNPTTWHGPLHSYSGGLTGPADVTITGPSTWVGGTWSGTGTTVLAGGVTFAAGGTLNLSRTIITQSASTWAGGNLFRVHGSWTQSGTLLITGDNTSHDGHFVNQGTITKSGATGITNIGSGWHGGATSVNNHGTINALTGSIDLHSTGAHTGAFGLTGAGTVRVVAGTHTLNSGASLGTGFHHVGGTLIASGTVNVAGSPLFASVLQGAGGTFTGPGTMRFTTTANKTVQGTGTFGARLLFDQGGVFAVNSDWTNTGLLEIAGTGNWHDGILRNSGTIRKTTSPADVNVANSWWGGTRQIHNNGIVESLSGNLRLNGGGTHGNAQFRSGPLGAVRFVEGFHSIAGPITSSGSVWVTGGTLGVTTGAQTWTGPLGVDGGNIGGAGDLRVNGRFIMTAGLKVDAGSLHLDSEAVLSGGGLRGGTTHLNGESVVNGNLFNVNGTIRNTGRLRLEAVTLHDGVYVNDGLILKESPGVANLATSWWGGARSITNNGTFEVTNGTLNFALSPTNFAGVTLAGGTWIVRQGGLLNITTGPVEVSVANIVLDGPGSTLLRNPTTDALATFRENLGSFTLLGGREFIRTGGFLNRGDVSIGGGSTLRATDGYTQQSGLTEVRGWLHTPTVQVSGGVLSGDGLVSGQLVNEAVVAPGSPSGVLTLNGLYFMTAAGTHRVRIQGGLPGEFGQIVVNGHVQLNGTLEVQNLGFAIHAGDTYRILTHTGSRTGTFTTVPDPADWAVVYGPNHVDLVAQRNIGAPVTVSGQVSLEGWIASPTARPITIDLMRGETVLETHVVNLDPTGHYTFSTRRSGVFSLRAKGAIWLRHRHNDLDLTPPAVTVDFTLPAGDCNDDNVVDLSDFLILAAAYDTTAADPGFDPAADLNGDDAVDLSDFLLLAANYDRAGD